MCIRASLRGVGFIVVMWEAQRLLPRAFHDTATYLGRRCELTIILHILP